MSMFNLHALVDEKTTGEVRRRTLVSMARTAEAAERYDDMCQLMKELVVSVGKDTANPSLTQDERNLLSVAYKNVIGARRASWRTLNADASNDENRQSVELLLEYKRQVEEELSSICKDVLDLLVHKGLISKRTDLGPEEAEAKVFYLKMAADYYRYLAECVPEETSTSGSQNKNMATEFYKQAFELAKEKLQATHPIRLGLALNYSVCLYEIMKDKTTACDLAKNAFDDAIAKLDKLEEADYKDSTLIMQLLRDNLTLWTTAPDAEA
jgi:hypothetical protein